MSEKRRRELTEPVAIAAALVYAALMVAVPFIGDESESAVVPLSLWVGGSVLAGAVLRRRSMLWIPAVVFVVLLGVVMFGLSDSEFFSDPLSAIALVMLALGQLVGLLVGWGASKLWRR
jgi:hypothetical protein